MYFEYKRTVASFWLNFTQKLANIPPRQNVGKHTPPSTLRAGAPDFRPLEEDDRRAVAAVASTDNTTESKFYAVRQGRCPGVYDSWAAMVPHTRGFKRAEFCKFDTRSAAEAWLHEQKPAQVEAPPSPTQSEREARIGAFLASIDFEALRDH